MPTSLINILDAYKASKASIVRALNVFNYRTKSSGTKDLSLSEPTDPSTGYWQNAASLSSKPPRWILHIDGTCSPPIADFARDPSGRLLPGAATLGYINNGEGKCAVAIFRLLPAIKTNVSPVAFLFPQDWEWIVALIFPEPLPPGTSGETLSEFDPKNGKVQYKGREATSKNSFAIKRIALIKMPIPPSAVNALSVPITYDVATKAIQQFLGAGIPVDVYDPTSIQDLTNLETNVSSSLTPVTRNPLGPKTIQPAPHLFAIPSEVYSLINAALKIGKQHFIFYGPPGTGKTTLAEHVAQQLSADDADNGEPYTFLTASSSWSGQDLVGGYQPLGPGKMGFVPGVMIRNFQKPIVIDELNRCPIDKVIGPLFSVLSGQATTLPYRTDITDPKSGSFKILPKPKDILGENEFAPGENWAIICTLNQIDKTQLGQVSYALSRRFTWIRVGSPENLRDFVFEILKKYDMLKGTYDPSLPNPVAEMWEKVNKIREIGGAPIIDFIRLVGSMDPSIDLLTSLPPPAQDICISVLGAAILPLLDGIRRGEAEDLYKDISANWKLSPEKEKILSQYIMDLAL